MQFGTRSIGSVLALVAVAMIAVNSGSSAVTSSATATSRSPLVGRWSQRHTCQELVGALRKAGLAATAPGSVGEYFPNKTPQQLAKKSDLCSGAAPLKHSHFFTKTGTFGSLDQHGQRADDGTYRILSHHRLRIKNADVNGAFHYRIINGNRLRLAPIITAAMRRQALAAPLDFSVATWEVAIAYTGQTWKRARCGAWCSS